MKKILFALVVAISGCTESQNKKFETFMASPTGQAIKNAAIAAADDAIKQYEDTGQVKGKEVAQASLNSVGQQLRGLQTTEDAANPTAIKEAVKKGSASSGVTKKVAPAVANAVTDAVKKGAPADLALEAAARGLDEAAKKNEPKMRPKKEPISAH
jgi:hypothetical protein